MLYECLILAVSRRRTVFVCSVARFVASVSVQDEGCARMMMAAKIFQTENC